MTTLTTSPETGVDALAPAASTTGEWRSYLAFLRRPTLPQKPAGFGGASLLATPRMLLLDLLIVAGLITLAMVAAAVFGFEPPDNALNNLEWSPIMVAAIVLVAPILEELGFRAWLSGRPGAVFPVLALGLGVAGTLVAPQEYALLAGGGLLVACVAAVVLAIVFRKGPPWRWFARIFPALFWLSTVCFALVHLANYTEGSLALLLPFVIPQLISGSIFGYARVRYGLWSGMLLHVLHNGALVTMIVSATAIAGDAI